MKLWSCKIGSQVPWRIGTTTGYQAYKTMKLLLRGCTCMETKMTSSFNNSIIGKAEYDGFVSNRAQASSGWCLNCCFKIMERMKKISNSLFIFVQKAKSNVKYLTVDTKDALFGKTSKGSLLRAGIIPKSLKKRKRKHE